MDRYQITCSMVLIGSKATGARPQATPARIADLLASALASTLVPVEREFKTGSTGFYVSGKLTVA